MAEANAARADLGGAAAVLVRVALYYAVLIAASVLLWRHLPRTSSATLEEISAMLAGSAVSAPRRDGPAALGDVTSAVTVTVAMLAAGLLALPVTWVYLLTRAKRGYQQSVVHTLVILPMVVAGIVVLVRDSLALAFSLAGIVAAVRFRTPLDDSKDAVYVFLTTGIGLACAVNIPDAAAISICFNVAILLLWTTDFGRTPVHLDGRLAEQRLRRAKALARTGTFVARIDEEVFRDMTAEQLEGVAERARRRAREHDPDSPAADDGASASDVQLLVRTRDVAAARATVEARLDAAAKRWRYLGAEPSADGSHVLAFAATMKKSRTAADLLDGLVSADRPELVSVELA